MKSFPATLIKISAVAAACILLYTVTGFLIVPPILKEVAVQQSTSFLGRAVSIRHVDFNPYVMSFVVRGVRVDDPQGGAVFTVESVFTTFMPLPSLLSHAWMFKEIVLVEPRVNILRNANGTASYEDLLHLKWPRRLLIRFEQVRLVEGAVHFHDESLSRGFSTTINHLTATFKDFSTHPDHANRFSVNAISESGETLSLNGSFSMSPLSSQGEIAVENVLLSKYFPYLEDRFDASIVEGTFAARASYDVDLARDHFRSFVHDVSISARSFKVNESGSTRPLMGFDGLTLSGGQVDLVRRNIKVDSIVITGGTGVLRRLPDDSFNVQHMMRAGRIPSEAEAASSGNWNVSIGEIRQANFAAEVNDVFGREMIRGKQLLFSKPTFQMNPPLISVDEVVLQGGEVVFTDPSVAPPAMMALTHLDIRVGGLSSRNPRLPSVSVHGMIGDGAPLQVFGRASPGGVQGKMDVRGLLRNMSLVPLSPYAAKYLGYEVAAGDLSLDVAFSMEDGKISALSTVKIDRLTFGGRTESKEATPFPVRLAVFLLKDSSGAITLNVPIERTPGETRFQLQKTIIDAVLTPFAKATTFPFAAICGASAGEELGVQEFNSGSTELIPAETAKLDAILKGLVLWPELILDIEGSVDATNDRGDPRLLASARARAVEGYFLLHGSLEPGRIFLIDDLPENVPRNGSRALLTLKDKYRRAGGN